MSSGRITVLLLVPGRASLSFELNARWPFALLGAMMASLMLGAAGQRCADGWQGGRGYHIAALDLTGSLQAQHGARSGAEELGPIHEAIAARERRDSTLFASISGGVRQSPLAALHADRLPDISRDAEPSVVRAKAILRAFSTLRVPPGTSEQAPADGWLRLQALHLGESIRVRPFDPEGLPDPQAFLALRHIMRCRVTGEEVPIDPRLIRILTRIAATYDRPIQLVSGHRTPHVIGTSSTSQHVLGKAADIRVPGVGIQQLRSLALRFGARGVGLYPEKGFVHVDVRDKPKYRWIYTEALGEVADMH